jgi:hypothetical protein
MGLASRVACHRLTTRVEIFDRLVDGGSVCRYSTVALPGWCLSCAGTDQVERSGSAALAMQAIILAIIRAVGYESYAELLIMTRGWVGLDGRTGEWDQSILRAS